MPSHVTLNIAFISYTVIGSYIIGLGWLLPALNSWAPTLSFIKWRILRTIVFFFFLVGAYCFSVSTVGVTCCRLSRFLTWTLSSYLSSLSASSRSSAFSDFFRSELPEDASTLSWDIAPLVWEFFYVLLTLLIFKDWFVFASFFSEIAASYFICLTVSICVYLPLLIFISWELFWADRGIEMSGKFYFCSLMPYCCKETGVALLSSIGSIWLLFCGAFIEWAGLFYDAYLSRSSLIFCCSRFILF